MCLCDHTCPRKSWNLQTASFVRWYLEEQEAECRLCKSMISLGSDYFGKCVVHGYMLQQEALAVKLLASCWHLMKQKVTEENFKRKNKWCHPYLHLKGKTTLSMKDYLLRRRAIALHCSRLWVSAMAQHCLSLMTTTRGIILQNRKSLPAFPDIDPWQHTLKKRIF